MIRIEWRQLLSLVLIVVHTAAYGEEIASNVRLNNDGAIVCSLRSEANPAQLQMKVWIAGTNTSKFPSLAGETNNTGSTITFTPRFPLRKGIRYVVKLLDGDTTRLTEDVFLPKTKTPKTRVVAVYPSAPTIPENVLRFYIEFSAPMQKGDVYQYVRLRKVDGDTIELPFLEIEQEFWSRDSRRLTLLLDPGRIKRGLRPREEMGPIFELDSTYELIADGTWPDAHGQPMERQFKHRFKVTAAETQRIDIRRWTVESPRTHRGSAVLKFDRSLDYGMLQRVIECYAKEGQLVSGKTTIGKHEKSLSFTPRKPWVSTEYSFQIDPTLEDVSGNNCLQAFDVDLSQTRNPASPNRLPRLQPNRKFQLKFYVDSGEEN